MTSRPDHPNRATLGAAAAHAGDAATQAGEAVAHAGEAVAQAAGRAAEAVKPILRGWIHAFTAPTALVVGIILVALTPAAERWSTAVFAATGVILFGLSAVYHRGNWSPRVHAVLRRLDHANIFLLIAGTYTPLAWILLARPTALLVLAIVWGGAAAGILLQVLWPSAPRWVYVPLYIALGWVAVWFLPAFWAHSPAIVWLLMAGGIAYTVGAGAYGFKRPNPWPRYFGFHEIFHVGTVVGWVCHVVAVFLAVAAI